MASLLGIAGCSSAASGSEDPDDGSTSGDLPDVTHFIEPTDQMRDAAIQQCVDDRELDVGYVKAVSPDTDDVLAEISVDCTEARSDG